MTFLLEFRTWDTGGPVVPGHLFDQTSGSSGRQAEGNLALASHVVFLLHGYNVNRNEGRTGLGHLAEFLTPPSGGAIVKVLWPGDSFFGVLSYPFEGTDADDTASEFARFIADVLTAGTRLSFITHSLGARVCMRTLELLRGQPYPVDQVCLMAPAIDDFSLAAPDEYRHAASTTGRIAVLSSTKDMVLKLAYPAGDLLESFIFFWRDEFGLALGYHGPRPFSDNGASHSIPNSVLSRPIDPNRGSDHGHYIPNFGPSNVPTSPKPKEENRKSAALFARDVLDGVVSPSYI